MNYYKDILEGRLNLKNLKMKINKHKHKHKMHFKGSDEDDY